ncbi:Uncharacterised protein [Mycobacterium tuberculosis]|nr:Uncharacterised protein [Mycobacterium tuberculosis]
MCMTSVRIRSAASRIRASFRICCITWIASISSDGDTSTIRAR